METNQTNILAPFDDGVQDFLRLVDKACADQMRNIKRERDAKMLANEDMELDMDTIGWLNMIRAYGVLFNRAVEAGWIKDVHLMDNWGNDEKAVD